VWKMIYKRLSACRGDESERIPIPQNPKFKPTEIYCCKKYIEILYYIADYILNRLHILITKLPVSCDRQPRPLDSKKFNNFPDPTLDIGVYLMSTSLPYIV